LARLGLAVTGLPLTTGNEVGMLHNGAAVFAAMLAAIHGATERVFLATYIFDSGPVGQQFVAALHAAAARGVDVRVLLDGLGERYSWPSVAAQLRGAGVRFARFLPPRLWPPAVSLNLRNHRKILVVEPAARVVAASVRAHLDGRLMLGFAGVEIMRRLLGVAQLPLAYGLDVKRHLLDLSRSLVLTPERGVTACW
jgi:phosphatidylserine/phosphatidylglycerophosphate/cardiolipin synthase-like enzyme